MYNTQVVGTIQYIEWLILNDRVQPSFIAGVGDTPLPVRIHTHYVHTAHVEGRFSPPISALTLWQRPPTRSL